MVIGLKSLERKLTRHIPRKVREATRVAMEKGAGEIVALMKSLVPRDEGKLAASIGWTWGTVPEGALAIASQTSDLGETITIYAGDRSTIVTNSRGYEFQNAILQEFGTQDMTPNPYFFPAFRTLRKRAASRITRAMKKAIREGAR